MWVLYVCARVCVLALEHSLFLLDLKLERKCGPDCQHPNCRILSLKGSFFGPLASISPAHARPFAWLTRSLPLPFVSAPAGLEPARRRSTRVSARSVFPSLFSVCSCLCSPTGHFHSSCQCTDGKIRKIWCGVVRLHKLDSVISCRQQRGWENSIFKRRIILEIRITPSCLIQCQRAVCWSGVERNRGVKFNEQCRCREKYLGTKLLLNSNYLLWIFAREFLFCVLRGLTALEAYKQMEMILFLINQKTSFLWDLFQQLSVCQENTSQLSDEIFSVA